ncbi:transcription factor SPEECHLESS-like [Phalaenopsis equestris]|uniref:transcription factor SPEECHLESS-like n=1 Tax=Phalaenopsis equestris TaxID=78828 RepID=UPI0009E1B9D3|nr:transcription factor SPEECHLESS-like [Phalaenopsis equestris]
MADALSEIFEEPESLFSMLETLEDVHGDALSFSMFEEEVLNAKGKEEGVVGMASHGSNFSNVRKKQENDDEEEDEEGGGGKRKKMKLSEQAWTLTEGQEGQPKISHITVERNRRKQMNEHLVVLRTLMPCFYVKRGDQASIIGGVVDYIKELQQLLHTLEAKKQRKIYSEVLSPRPLSSPRHLSSPRPPPSPRRPSPLCSPRVAISPRTPQQGSPYKPNRTQQGHLVLSPSMASSHESSPSLEAYSTAELVANYRSSQQVADVEVKFSGPNVLLKTVSHRIPGQALKIIAVLEGLALEILHLSISTTEDTMLFSFTIKIGIECELSAEELANEIQQTFS